MSKNTPHWRVITFTGHSFVQAYQGTDSTMSVIQHIMLIFYLCALDKEVVKVCESCNGGTGLVGLPGHSYFVLDLLAAAG